MMVAVHRLEHLMDKVEPTLLQAEAIKLVCPHDHVLTDREILFKSNHYNVYLQCDLEVEDPMMEAVNPFDDLMAQQELQVGTGTISRCDGGQR